MPDTRVKQNLYESSLVWDAHAGIFPSPDVDLHILSEWNNAGVSYLSINVGFDVMDWQDTLATLASYRNQIARLTEICCLVSDTEAIETARANSQLAVSFDIEGVNALNGNPDMIEVYHRLGVRQMLFAYNLNNMAAGGCHDSEQGLTDFGRQVVREMNRVGMLVDCSHASFTTTMDIMEESAMPVVFSHSNPAAVWSHQRNINNTQIEACVQTGGVIGVNGLGIFIGDNDIDNATIMKHICHLAEVAGPEHIGLGLDYSPKVDLDIGEILKSRPDFWPAGQQYDTKGIKHAGPDQLEGLTELMKTHGFSDGEIAGILGGNFFRVASKVWSD